MKKFLVVALMVVVLLAPGVVRSQAPFDARVLIWEFTPQDDGQVQALSSDGSKEVVLDFPQGVFGNVAMPCGHDHWTEEGKGIALFTGAAEGDIAIYPVEGGDPVGLGHTHRMACAGPTAFQFSSDKKRVGYIDYVEESLSQEFPYGNLRLFEAETGTEVTSFDWTNSFALYNDGAIMLRFYPDGLGNASEADLDWWDGSSRRTVTTLEPLYPPDKPDVVCGLVTGSMLRVDDTIYVLTAQRCATGTSNWRVVSVSMDDGSVTEIALGTPAGGFFPESFTVQLIPVQDGSGFLVTSPSGLARNTIVLQWLSKDGTVTPMLEGRHVVADRFGERLSEARHMLVSMDGSRLAFITSTGDQEQTLWTLDLSTIGGEPVQVDEEGRNQRVFQYVWSANNYLYYAAGSIESNSLHQVAPGETSQRMSRGRFFRLAVNYDGTKIAAAEWYANPNSVGDDLFKLTVLDAEGRSFTLKEGGEEHNQMIPLAIR